MTVTSSDGRATFPLSLAPMVVCFCGILLLIAAYQHPLSVVIGYWESPEYSHAFLLPPIAALIAWHRLIEKRVKPSPAWGGLAIMMLGAFLLAAGELSTFDVIALYGFIIALMGLFATVFGFKTLNVMLPGFICLFFAVPLPQLIFVALSAQMQLISSDLGVFVLDLLNVPVYQEGNIIDLGGIQLQVADACSGLRYLFPLMSFAFIVAYLYRAAAWKRILIFLTSVPLTISMNSLRIALIGVTVDQWGIRMAQGVLHEMEGWTIFLICALLLMGEVYALRAIGRPGLFRLHYLSLPQHMGFAPRARIGAASVTAIFLAGVFAVIADSGVVTKRQEYIPPHQSLSEFPLVLDDWQGRATPLQQNLITALNFTDYWSADYVRPQESGPVNLYVAYYARQDLNNSIHSPSNCIPAGGWQVMESGSLHIAPGIGHGPLDVTRMRIQRGGGSALIYYWFNERGRDLTNQYAAKWYLLLDAITMDRSDGSLIRLVTPLDPKETTADADRRMEHFLSVAMPTLNGYQ